MSFLMTTSASALLFGFTYLSIHLFIHSIFCELFNYFINLPNTILKFLAVTIFKTKFLALLAHQYP